LIPPDAPEFRPNENTEVAAPTSAQLTNRAQLWTMEDNKRQETPKAVLETNCEDSLGMR
jgi:hypothetical protein